MGIVHDNPPCEFCEGVNTYSTYDSGTNYFEMDCYECGYGVKEDTGDGTWEKTLMTTWRCGNCNHGIGIFSIGSEGQYIYDCSECNHQETHAHQELFASIKPEDQWYDFLSDGAETWKPCEAGCGNYWYDSDGDSEPCCWKCRKQQAEEDIWQDL